MSLEGEELVRMDGKKGPERDCQLARAGMGSAKVACRFGALHKDHVNTNSVLISTSAGLYICWQDCSTK